jgi:quinol monooxygenase YgiN
MRLSHLIVGLAVLRLAALRPVHAEDPPVYIVTYFEVAPPAAAETAALARQYADASRKEAGNAGFAMFAEIGRPNRFAILEAWRDKAAYEAHGATASTTAYRDKAGSGYRR